ncbi:RNA methyltransferase [Rhodococcus sp. RS1C4]|nr:RNA methyltransferase [Rhodococcus sp. RS1C4]OZC61546.1 RNA methyltransferase [Rhodococcus sp. 06-621-2]OZD13327.1 RNA methyltransferase [Rhodococcus sp. 06-156-4C]OZD16075.1 RNA methyltransferase [Rhodococcus sp. 06-156-3C]OZD17430.1 RNA methyltransferase [Rhodococcus sp. 06-156-4a]OZD34797.1 RNA methyltransferase [Rhodococcus sp. 06-156-3b]OZD36178.1 RNA methyltransferase [Rhodococcus sp. 06-156-3]OZE78533.1 RNA methyltransferase [Rhodococcus sp. 15-649-1-2]OZF00182.1 RNA methyltransfe
MTHDDLDPKRPVDTLTERTPRVVSAVKLLRASERKKTGLFLAEGTNSVAEALHAGVAREVFFREDSADRNGVVLDLARTTGVPVHAITERAAKGLSDTVTPPGVVAVCRTVDVDVRVALAGTPQLVAVPVEVSEPGNAGTVIRVADAVGADSVILLGDAVDPHNGKCVRASAGSVFHLPIARERSVNVGLDALRAAGVTILATAADGDVDLDDADELLSRPTAWLFGNEAHGLAPAVAAAADHRVRIPIHGRAESLNLATAAAICLYASARAQRRSGHK